VPAGPSSLGSQELRGNVAGRRACDVVGARPEATQWRHHRDLCEPARKVDSVYIRQREIEHQRTTSCRRSDADRRAPMHMHRSTGPFPEAKPSQRRIEAGSAGDMRRCLAFWTVRPQRGYGQR